jgi:carboxylesterase
MPIMPGAEAYSRDGGKTGVLLCHGFTGTPQSMRPWAEYLANEGYGVSVPRLPGHGTTWQEMSRTRWEDWFAEVDRAFDELRSRSDEIFVTGQSMGGCLALRLAELRNGAISGLVLVNPSVTADSKIFLLSPVLKLILPSVKGVAADLKNEQAEEVSYDRTPVKAAATLPGLWKTTQRDLGKLTQPILVYRSETDHVVGPKSLQVLRAALPASQLEVRMLGNSYHVATLDNDAQTIFAGSLDFIRQHSRAGTQASGGD